MTPVRWMTALSLAAGAGACGGDASTLTVAGTIEIREVRLAPLASGRLTRLLKDEGDSVRPGDTVAVLEQPGMLALIEQRRAQATAAGARTGEVAAAEADSARAASDLERARRLVPGGGISQQQFDAARSAAAAAAARLGAARAALSDVPAAGAAVAVARAARDQLVVLAPADGIVLTRFAEVGEAIAAGMPVVAIGLVHRPWVRAYVGERFVGRIRVGQDAQVRIDAYPDTSFPGRVTEIASRAEFTPRAALTERERADLVFGIKVEVADAGGRLKAGMPVEIALPLLP
jgi:membrane fusion protein YbhG